MRHPFDGIIVPKAPGVESAPPQKTRRTLLKVLLGAVAALFGFVSRASAQKQPSKNVLSLALGEAGGTALTQAFKEEAGDPTKDPTVMRKEEGGITTKALNEEGATTNAIGEEGGKLTKALKEDGGRVTTLAVGEEGASTRAVGEEGGRLTKALNEDGGPKVTTFAVGEEGGKLTQALNEDGGPPKATTNALGEEGGKN